MGKIDLLPANGHFYKANLHCHSTLSDGRLTPAQLKEAYKAQGYSVLCITDHELLLDHSDLNDKDFLALTGYEISVNDEETGKRAGAIKMRVCHINFYSPRPDYVKYICYDPTKYNDHMRESLDLSKTGEVYDRVYSPECVNDMVRIAHETGFLCSYNHPTWSLEAYPDYTRYSGFDMMEMVNYGCVKDGYEESNGHAYDEMLRAGHRLSCSATDDNHNFFPLDDPRSDSFGGFVWLKAPSLAYEDVMEALRYGDFYASTGGPQIETLEVQDGKVHIRCTPAASIRLGTDGRHAEYRGARPGETLTDETFTLSEEDRYFRLKLTDEKGLKSYTRAYFLDELK